MSEWKSKFEWGMVIFMVLLFIFMATGCSYGPFNITHERGSMPKGHVAIPYGGKLRVLTVDKYHIDGVKIVWKRSFK